MKLYKHFWALVALTLPLGFVSCSSDDEKEDTEVYEFKEPENKDNAARFVFDSEETPVQSVAFGESNTAVIEQENEDGEIEYVVGTYTKSGDTYVVTTQQGQYTFAIDAAPVGGTTDRVQATITTPGQPPVTTTATKTTSNETQEPTILGTWYPFKTKINMTKRGGTGTVTDELNGVDFQALKARAEKEGCHIKDNLDGWVVDNAFFQGTGEFGVNFTNKKSYYATWRWVGNNGDLNFDWKDKESINNEFVKTGKAHAQVFKTGIYKGELWLSLTSEVKQDNGDVWDVTVIFRLVDHRVI